MLTNSQSGTNVNEIASGIYRINTPVSVPDGPGQFSFNQYLILDEEPMVFHTGPRRMFPLVREAIETVMPIEQLRYVGLSHFEADECGALNDFLAVAPRAMPVCGRIAALVSVTDVADRAPRALADGELLSLGQHKMRWFDTPHMPHGWECGLMLDTQTSTFFCGDLFTQPGTGDPAVTEGDILGPSEALRAHLDYFSHAPDTGKMLERFAAERPATLACMHGSAWRGDGSALLRELATALGARHTLQAT
jgi:flavorubredoxin